MRVAVLVTNSSTSRCLLESDYSIQQDLAVHIYGFDPVAKQVNSSVSIQLEKQPIRIASSLCAYYCEAVLQSDSVLQEEGSYIFVASLKNGLI